MFSFSLLFFFFSLEFPTAYGDDGTGKKFLAVDANSKELSCPLQCFNLLKLMKFSHSFISAFRAIVDHWCRQDLSPFLFCC